MAFQSLSPRSFNVHPATNRIAAEVRLSIAAERNSALFQALYAVQYADQTGRTSGTASLALRRLSGYQYAKLVIGFVGVSGSDVARLLNEKFS